MNLETRPIQARKIIAFGFVSLILLWVGLHASLTLWRLFHSRYEMPAIGFYYGAFHGQLDSFQKCDESFALRINGESTKKWYWSSPTNFTYTTLSLKCSGASMSEQDVELSLPSLAYHSAGSTGVLTGDLLAAWLLDPTNNFAGTNANVICVREMFDVLRAAGNGTLPPPRHHTYYFEIGNNRDWWNTHIMSGSIQHFQLGYGYISYPYIWAAAWLAINVWLIRRWFKSRKKLNAIG